MSLSRVLAAALALVVLAPPAFAKGSKAKDADPDADASADDTSTDDTSSDDASSDDEEAAGSTKKAKPKAAPADVVKQDLSGHDLGTKKKANEFEKDRFFADKADTEKTEKGTLTQGSLSSSSLYFTESGGNYNNAANQGKNSALYSRMFTDLRLQTDFRHIGGGKWDARVDARARLVNTPPDCAGCLGQSSADPTHIQSGFNGTNEYDIRELWLFRSGKRTDLFFGRQFIADLGAIKFDGLRFDYASSNTLTLIGFAGLYPVRGSRSITTDYTPLKTNDLATAGRFVGAGGFGGAYRTVNAYGSVGGVVLAPLAGEQPRVFATSTGYLRRGATLDFYHFALIDLLSAAGAGLTNLSAGVNYKPNQRLRATASYNRVDVDTLNVQANAFLNAADATTPAGANTIQNETFFHRLSTNAARGGLSAGLGQLERFEVSTAATYRFRPAVTLLGPPVPAGMTRASVTLEATKGVDLYVSLTDRRSIKNARIGIDASRSFALGKVAFERNEVSSFRLFVGHELAEGRGEWEGELSYATTKDTTAGITCDPIGTPASIGTQCFGSSVGAIISVGGNVFYRINRDWFTSGTLFLTRQTLTHGVGATAAIDPPVTGLMGFFRIAYRF